MPDRLGFEHFDGGTRPELRCIECGAKGPPSAWPIERREQHHRSHLEIADAVAAEKRLVAERARLQKAVVDRRDRHVVPPRPCANPFCSVVFQPKRSTGRYCSGACKVAAWRARHAGGEAPPA
jgi:hypothetical protein